MTTSRPYFYWFPALVCLLALCLAGAAGAQPIPGDSDGDGDVDGADLQVVLDNFGRSSVSPIQTPLQSRAQTPGRSAEGGMGMMMRSLSRQLKGPALAAPLPGDLDADGFVGFDDLRIILINWTGPIAPTRPNIVLIMSDDQGFETLGAYGALDYDTPRLDALADNGITFDHCYAQPICTPSRVKIMTGRSNIRNYIEFNILDPDETTFGHILQDAGYRTAVAGKWQLYGSDHRPNPGTGMHPSNAGFDEHLLWQVETLVGPNDLPFGQRDNRYWGPYLNANGTEAGYPAGSIEFDEDQYVTDLFTDFLCDFMAQESDDPFFVYFPMVSPHNPFQRTPDSPDLTDANKYQASANHFDDMVAYVDKTVGRIVDHLEQEGLLDNTIIIFVGDNGTNTGITSQLIDGPFRGGKGQMTDAGTRVPCIVHWPAGQPAGVRGTRSDALIDFSDIVPTLAQAAETELPQTMMVDGNEVPAIYDGHSFLPHARGEDVPSKPWAYVYYNRDGGNLNANSDGQWARTQRYKLYGEGGVSRAGNFYDLQTDPQELNALDPQALDPEAQAARTLLLNAIQQMQLQQGVGLNIDPQPAQPVARVVHP